GAMDTLLSRYEADGASFLDGNPKELLPGLRYLGDLAGSALYAVQNGQEWYLFDAPGGSALSAFVEQHLPQAGTVGSKITAVLLTSTASASTSGLAELARKTGCRVVAPAAGLEDVRRLCPPETDVVAADQLTKVGDFALRAIPLGGRGTPALAYSLRR